METVSLTNLVDKQGDVLVDFTIDRENGTVVARASLANVPESDTNGYAFTHPDDKFDEQVGIELAAGRALQELGTKLLRRGNKVVNQRDKFRRKQQKASEKAVAQRKAKSEEVKAERAGNLPKFKVGDRVEVVTKTLDGGILFGQLGTVERPRTGSSSFTYVRMDKDNGRSAQPCPFLAGEIKKVSDNSRENLPA